MPKRVGMDSRRRFTGEFKHDAVRLVTRRGVTTTRRNHARDQASDPVHAFPGEGQRKPQLAELTRLHRKIAKLEMERGILKKSHGPVHSGVDVTGRLPFAATGGLHSNC